MSGDGKRDDGYKPQVTAPIFDSTVRGSRPRVRVVLALILSLSLSKLFLRTWRRFALEAVAKKAAAPALFPSVPDMGLAWVKVEAVLRHPGE